MAQDWLNYHHLLYFYTVAREGSVAAASRHLSLAQPTISSQIRSLEDSLGGKLFARSGRGLVLSDFGRLIYRYAEDIFSAGRELQDVIKGRPPGGIMRLAVGISDAMQKLVAHRILEPVLRLQEPVRMICHEGKPEHLLADLRTRSLDVILADSPMNPRPGTTVFNHLLGSCGTAFLAAPSLASRYRRNFPESLHRAPCLLPAGSAYRLSLDQWLSSRQIEPHIVAEFDDNALLKVFGQNGAGIFPVPAVIEKEVRSMYKVSLVGRTSAVVDRFFAISIERKFKHPAVVAISEAARSELFRSS
ncbi:MAG: transcriptional activator NhaR [Bryobacteraceae bacterium]|nr:transcriptional activator NhaR [Bryobacteraceae bacterium]